MKNTRKILAGAIAAAALAASGALVYAASATPEAGWSGCPYGGSGPGAMGYGPGAGRGAMGPGMMGQGPGAGRGTMGHGPGMWSNPAAAVEGRLAALKVEIKITPEQDSAWQAFTTKARQQADGMAAQRAQMFAQMSATGQTVPDRLAQRTEHAKQRIAGMESITAAVNDLYGVLTPEQKTIADQQLARGPMGGFGGHGFRR